MLAVTVGLLPPALAAEASRVNQGPPSGLRFRVVSPPAPVIGTDILRHLAYEIVVQNTSGKRIRLEQMVVRDAKDHRVVQTFDAGEIKAVTFRYGKATIARTRTVAPRSSVVMILDVTTRVLFDLPETIEHRFTSVPLVKDKEPEKSVTVGAPTTPGGGDPTRLSPPLQEEELAVLGCCGAPLAHRLAVMDLGSGIQVAQRFAIDFIQTNDQLASFAGDPLLNENYFIYGDELRAVAPGTVVATRDGVAENVPGSLPAGIGVDDAAGNFVTIDIGNEEFALYAHLQPGSLTVQPGDAVTTGQIIGRVGNSGNSSEPHLHFHLMDGAGGSSGLNADGVPYVFDAFRIEARISGLDLVPPSLVRERPPLPMQRVDQLPLNGDVVSFGGLFI
jgi:hypothetical protein